MTKMKDTSIDWIGKIPKKWRFLRFKNFLKLVNIPSTSSRKIGLENIEGETGRFIPTENHFEGNGVHFSINDIVYGKLRPYLQKVWLAEFEGNAIGDFFVFSSRNISIPKYVKWLMLSDGFTKIIESSTYGAKMPRVASEFILNLPFYLPPKLEQSRIADFLDKKCAEIDELIALQNQMIAILDTYKQSVITEAVTRGLNPDAPMRDSGIEWIGEIPEHWEVSKLNYFVSKIGSGSTPTGGSEVYTNCGVKFLRSQNVYFDGFRLDDIAYITDEIDESMKGTRVIEGDVLLNITGGSIGRCYFVDSSLGRANVNQHVSIVRPNSKTNTKYLKYFLQSGIGQEQIQMLQTGGNREGLSAAALKQFRFLYLPLTEQQAIADYLDKKCADIDSLIELKQSKIDSLKEYKKSIIYEYVTGKKEVV